MTPATTTSSNSLTRFVFDGTPVRGLHIQLSDVWQHIEHHKTYPTPIRSALGELLAATVLLASNLKFDGNLIAQIQGQGALKMLVAEATSNHTCRATARWDEQANISDDASLTELLGQGGMFVLTLQPANGESWQGIVALEGNSIAQMLTAYMARSEQLDTFISLSADEQHAAGLLLQRLPEQAIGEHDWTHVTTLAQTLTPTELLNLDATQVLYRLFHETPPRVFSPQNIEFACTCSRGKVSDMLLLLGSKEVGEAVAEQGSIEINCDFCHQRYVFDETDINSLFGSDIVNTARQLHQPLLNH
ncbi:Hsp33 family molecular chaperone HslO [Snodgrassella sp. CFCC 13594]|uniref:Hsp33 family molecular chaperone HslO n=1 Tax=Snodgrassella sp. CFCC 13594 TaxID=1775559 RepID=UPI000835A005|nr:Hsp33 family molecular chaperone HslO [Snodgrassella sp. CFCC 13594]